MSNDVDADANNAPQLKQRLIEFASRNFIFAVTVLSLLTYALHYMGHCYGPPIRSDGAGYYAYLPSYLIYGDPSFEELAQEQYSGHIPEWTGITRYEGTSRYLDMYGPGVAVMMMPFFLTAHVLTWLFKYPADVSGWYHLSYPMDGYSPFYQHAAGLAGLFYMVAGLFVLKTLLERYFSKGVTLATLASLLLGTNLLFYGTAWTVLTHAYSFFLFSSLLYLTTRWYEQPRSMVISGFLGLTVGLIALVRVPNVLVLIMFLLFGIHSLDDAKQRIRLFLSNAKTVSLAAGIALLVFLPQLLAWKYATGRLLVNAYSLQGGHFDFSRLEILNVLFSLKKGLFFWSPILLLCIPGLWKLMRSPARDMFTAAMVYLPLNLYMISSWWQWWFGASFGHRAFVESFAIWAFPLAALYGVVSSRIGRLTAVVFSIACVVYSLFFMKLFFSHEIGAYGLDASALYDIIWARKEWVLEWLTR